MSFSYDVKTMIMKTQYKASCCRKALLQGIVLSKGYIDEENKIYINLEKQEMIDFTSSLIKEFYGKNPDITSPPKGGRCKRLSFESKSLKNFILNLSNSESFLSEKCAMCKPAFLKGIFFACGRVSDPKKQFCLEFSTGNRINLFSNLFEDIGIDLKSAIRKSECILYTKNSSVIEDFFAAADINDVAYTFMNIKIANDFLNNANRLRNFDTVNISKAVAAAGTQYEIIKKLIENNLLGLLPEELHETAKLRFENPDMSLGQLAMHSVPPISKSGITHRLNKIVKLGKALAIKYNLE